MSDASLSFAGRLYERLMGVGAENLSRPTADQLAAEVRLRDVIYYAYEKGGWPLLRGLLFRPRLQRSSSPFFLGKGCRLLFPSHLSVGANVAIGDHVYMNCFGRSGVTLGDHVRLREFGSVQVTSHLSNPGEGLDIGARTYIGPHCVLGAAAGIRIGKEVTLGAYVQVLAENHEFEDADLPVSQQGVVRKGIVIEDGCWLGNSVIVLDGVHIGRNAVVGAGSIVTRSLPSGGVAAGNPARILRQRS